MKIANFYTKKRTLSPFFLKNGQPERSQEEICLSGYQHRLAPLSFCPEIPGTGSKSWSEGRHPPRPGELKARQAGTRCWSSASMGRSCYG